MLLGGEQSHRGLANGRSLGTGQLFANLEVRQDILVLGDLGAIGVLAFADGGRVFEGDFSLSFNRWKLAAGGGLMIRLLRSYITTLNFAGGQGFQFTMTSGWFF